MLQNSKNATYMAEDADVTEESNFLKDYKDEHSDRTILLMASMNCFIIILAFIHLCDLLKIYHTFVILMGFTQ